MNDDSSRNSIATSLDVARAARVSQSTVSLVLNGKSEGRVSEATRDAVLAAAAQLGYAPNMSARMLRTGIGKTLAFAVPNVQQPYFGQVLVAAELAARQKDYAILLVDTTSDPQWSERLVAMIRSRLIAGCLAYAPDAESEAGLLTVINKVVLIESNTASVSAVDLDIEAGMKAVVRHLVALGHRRIGHFAAQYPRKTFRRRKAALRAELELREIEFHSNWSAESMFEIEAATQAAQRLIATGVTAIVCDDDLLAGAVYRAARQLGLRIPDQISVTGFNDVELARLLDPELTTLAIPAEAVGGLSIRQLLDKLEGHSDEATPVTVQLELRIRGSTAAVTQSAL